MSEKVEIERKHLVRLTANTKKVIEEGNLDEYKPDEEAVEAAEEALGR